MTGFSFMPVFVYVLIAQMFSVPSFSKRDSLEPNATSSKGYEHHEEFLVKLKTFEERFELSKDDVEEHLDKRTSQLFILASLVHNKKLELSLAPTIHQGLFASSLEPKIEEAPVGIAPTLLFFNPKWFLQEINKTAKNLGDCCRQRQGRKRDPNHLKTVVYAKVLQQIDDSHKKKLLKLLPIPGQYPKTLKGYEDFLESGPNNPAKNTCSLYPSYLEELMARYKNHEFYSPEDFQEESKIKMEGAHGATIPRLYAQKQGKKKKIFLDFSGFYDESNETISMLKKINEADTFIDGKENQKRGLRIETIKLLNAVSQGTITPKKCLKQFLEIFCQEVLDRIERCDNEEKTIVLRYYLKVLKNIQEDTKKQDYYENILNLNLSDPVKKEYFRVLCQLLEEEPVSSKSLKTTIRQRALALSSRILERSRQYSDRTPNHFQSLFLRTFLEAFSENERPYVEKALGKNYLKLQVKSFSNSNRTVRLINGFQPEILQLAEGIKVLLAGNSDPEVLAQDPLPHTKAKLDNELLKLRTNFIQKEQKYQGQIKKKLQALLESLKPKYAQGFNDRFYGALFHFADKSLRLKLAKLLNKSPEDYKFRRAENEFTKQNFEEFYRSARRKILRVNHYTNIYRAELLNYLFHHSSYKLERLVREFRRIAPGLPMSNGTFYNLSRVDSNYFKILTKEYMAAFSKIFGVNISLWNPGSFAND